MASTPIYNWPTPDNTDLVKNGALAIRTLGDAIDTTVDTMIPETIFAAKGDLLGASANDTPAVLTVGANGETLVADSSTSTGLKWAAPASVGMTLISTSSFSAVASVSLANSTFSSTYLNYKIMFNLTGASTALTVTTRLRASGSDNTTSNYFQMSQGITSASGGSDKIESGTTSWTIEATAASPIWVLDFDLLNPNTATRTEMVGFLVCDNNTNILGRSIRALHNANTSFDAMSFIASTGNFTGSVSVYGYNK
jgi:hypothetical protein